MVTQGPDVDSSDWHNIQVRRLLNMVERDIKNALAPLPFQPNDPLSWEPAHVAIYNYLARLWQKGALQGNCEQEAFHVQLEQGNTMTQDKSR